MSISVSVLVSSAGLRPLALCSPPPSSVFSCTAHLPFFWSTYLCLNPLGSLNLPGSQPLGSCHPSSPVPSTCLSSYPLSSLRSTWPSSNSFVPPFNHLVPAFHFDFPSTCATHMRPNINNIETYLPMFTRMTDGAISSGTGFPSSRQPTKTHHERIRTTTPCGSPNTS